MDVPVTEWHGCYDDGWGDLIVSEAYAHPAKFAKGLIERIIEHGLAQGYWQAGDTLGDPFGGVALGGIIAGYHGLNWIGVELEQKFVELGNQNIALHKAKWAALGYDVDVRLVQGDSRQFAALACDGIVTSPPYTDCRQTRDKAFLDNWCQTHGRNANSPCRKATGDVAAFHR
jgi:DNA modification methylase